MKHTDLLHLFNDLIPVIDDNSKLCTKCNVVKQLTSFPWRSGEKVFRREHCRQCVKSLSQTRKMLRKRYGMPDNTYICPICLGTSKDVAKRGGKHAGSWVLDHCHYTDKFRGWLCHLCNRALGCFKDDVNMLQRAIEYLNNNGEDYE